MKKLIFSVLLFSACAHKDLPKPSSEQVVVEILPITEACAKNSCPREDQFRKLDKNHDDEVDVKTELKGTDKKWKKADLNHDGKIGLVEFMQATEEKSGEKK